MTPAQLTYTLEALSEEAHRRWPRINWGGCGVFASIMHTALAHNGIESMIVLDNQGYGASVEEARLEAETRGFKPDRVSDWNALNVSIHHILLYIPQLDCYFDSEGLQRGGLPDPAMVFEPHEVHAMASKVQGWNTEFRRTSIPAIEQLVANMFSLPTPRSVEYVLSE